MRIHAFLFSLILLGALAAPVPTTTSSAYASEVSVFIRDLVAQVDLHTETDPESAVWEVFIDPGGLWYERSHFGGLADFQFTRSLVDIESGQSAVVGGVPLAPTLGYAVTSTSSDVVTVSSAQHNGTEGYALVRLLVAGSISATMSGVAPLTPNASAGATLYVSFNGEEVYFGIVGCDALDPSDSKSFNEEIIVEYGLTYGAPGDLTLETVAGAEIDTSDLNVAPLSAVSIKARVNVAGSEKQKKISGLAWVGMTDFFTASGEPVTDVVVTSESGTDYTMPSPVPTGRPLSIGALKARYGGD